MKERSDQLVERATIYFAPRFDAPNPSARATKSEDQITKLYLCDGEVLDCPKTSCYKNNGDCRHTTDVSHALNHDCERCFVSDDFGHLWETGEATAQKE